MTRLEIFCTHDWDDYGHVAPAGPRYRFCEGLCHRNWIDGEPEPKVVVAYAEVSPTNFKEVDDE